MPHPDRCTFPLSPEGWIRRQVQQPILPPGPRHAIRRTDTDRFHTWLKEQRAQVLPKSPMAEAIGYALNNGNALRRYTEAGYLSIDNNQAEREMKRIAIRRKNWLFVGSDKGGETAAVLFSFTSTCHRLGINSWTYLQDVLTRLPTMPAERLVELLPDQVASGRGPTGATLGSPSPIPDARPARVQFPPPTHAPSLVSGGTGS